MREHERKSRALAAEHAAELKKRDAGVAHLQPGVDSAPASGSAAAAGEKATAEVG